MENILIAALFVVVFIGIKSLVRDIVISPTRRRHIDFTIGDDDNEDWPETTPPTSLDASSEQVRLDEIRTATKSVIEAAGEEGILRHDVFAEVRKTLGEKHPNMSPVKFEEVNGALLDLQNDIEGFRVDTGNISRTRWSLKKPLVL